MKKKNDLKRNNRKKKHEFTFFCQKSKLSFFTKTTKSSSNLNQHLVVQKDDKIIVKFKSTFIVKFKSTSSSCNNFHENDKIIVKFKSTSSFFKKSTRKKKTSKAMRTLHFCFEFFVQLTFQLYLYNRCFKKLQNIFFNV